MPLFRPWMEEARGVNFDNVAPAQVVFRLLCFSHHAFAHRRTCFPASYILCVATGAFFPGQLTLMNPLQLQPDFLDQLPKPIVVSTFIRDVEGSHGGLSFEPADRLFHSHGEKTDRDRERVVSAPYVACAVSACWLIGSRFLSDSQAYALRWQARIISVVGVCDGVFVRSFAGGTFPTHSPMCME